MTHCPCIRSLETGIVVGGGGGGSHRPWCPALRIRQPWWRRLLRTALIDGSEGSS